MLTPLLVVKYSSFLLLSHVFTYILRHCSQHCNHIFVCLRAVRYHTQKPHKCAFTQKYYAFILFITCLHSLFLRQVFLLYLLRISLTAFVSLWQIFLLICHFLYIKYSCLSFSRPSIQLICITWPKYNAIIIYFIFFPVADVIVIQSERTFDSAPAAAGDQTSSWTRLRQVRSTI